ncbi:MAG TPA: hypothetical protein VFV34_13615 [Blastocatellia bacterium]|nr:hypothetical protein [Blastocatellia bacterium]
MMTNRPLRNTSNLVLAAALITVGSTLRVTSFAQQSSETLYDQTKRAGGKLVVHYRPDRGVLYANIEELAKRTEIILVGRIMGGRARLSADGKFITKDFLVKVVDVIRGDLRPGSAITVTLPGGSYRFSDGGFVLVDPAGYRQAKNGKLYAFFLKPPGERKSFEPVSQTQALFELTTGKVEPADLVRTTPLVSKYKGKDVPEFLADIQRAVGRVNGKK